MSCSARLKRLKPSFWIHLCILILLCILLLTIIGFTRWQIDIWPPERLKIIISNGEISRTFKANYSKLLGSDDNRELNQLSLLMLQEIEDFEVGRKCSPPFLKCGLYYPCGLGCQIHHRALCLMTAFVLNFTLIHEYNRNWPYNKKWPKEFQHMVSDCDTNNQPVYKVNWKRKPPEIIDEDSGHSISFPFIGGIPIPATLLNQIKHFHKAPSLWWLSHFVFYAMDLVPSEKQRINEWLDLLKIMKHWSPIAGLHVRRTDKIAEKAKSNKTLFHDLEEYMVHANNFFTNHSPPLDYPWQIFIASEDVSVYKEFKEQYGLPKWRVLGFPPVTTTKIWKERRDFLDEIIRDVILLSHCDLVVCGFSSNVCRLVYELMQVGLNSNKTVDTTKKVISVDMHYAYIYSAHNLNLKNRKYEKAYKYQYNNGSSVSSASRSSQSSGN